MDWYGFVIPNDLAHRVAGASIAKLLPGASAWEAFSYTDILLALLALLAIALFIAQSRSLNPTGPIALTVWTTAFAAIMILVVAYRLVNQPGPNEFIEVRAGGYLGFLATVGVFVGAARSMRDERPRAAQPMPPVDERPAPPA